MVYSAIANFYGPFVTFSSCMTISVLDITFFLSFSSRPCLRISIRFFFLRRSFTRLSLAKIHALSRYIFRSKESLTCENSLRSFLTRIFLSIARSASMCLALNCRKQWKSKYFRKKVRERRRKWTLKGFTLFALFWIAKIRIKSERFHFCTCLNILNYLCALSKVNFL